MVSLLSKLFTLQKNNDVFLPSIKHLNKSPCFVVDTDTVSDRLTQLTNSLSTQNIPHKIAFSFKTNYEFAKCSFLSANKLLAETVSSSEYSLAKKLKFADQNIIINGPNKGSLAALVKTRSLIHLDNFSEITELINQKNRKISANIGIRLNTNIIPSRFGFNIENNDAIKAVLLLQKNGFDVSSLHIHLGSDIYFPQLYQKTANLVSKFINQNKIKIKTIDFGGGFPAHGQTPYGQKMKETPDISEYISAIKSLFDDISYSPTLILEPGRYLIDDATYFITKIIDYTHKNGLQTITSDSTINMLPSLWYRPPTILVLQPNFLPVISHQIDTVIYGCSCQEHDILFRGKLPRVDRQHFVIFQAVGAYNQSMTPGFIFPPPKTYIY